MLLMLCQWSDCLSSGTKSKPLRLERQNMIVRIRHDTDRTAARGMIGYWHDAVVRRSVCL